MPKIIYINKRFSTPTLAIVDQANAIIEEYEAQGFTLTLRQLYYQFVARDVFPDDRRWRWTGAKWIRDPDGTKNAFPNYKWLGDIINDARLAGLIDWEHLEDRMRGLRELAHWTDPQDIIAAAVRSYHVDMWERQTMRIEVWIEKDALLGLFAGVCNEFDIPYFSCRGYNSQTEMWKAAQRIIDHANAGQDVYILHFGDHDPSGMDMTRDITDRLELFCYTEADVNVKRMALNWDQIEQFTPPPNFAKMTDSRANAYVAEFGIESWELDAMEPAYLAGLVRSFAESVYDERIWDEDYERREAERKQLKIVNQNWTRILKFLGNGHK
jgi:hypothetical protein